MKMFSDEAIKIVFAQKTEAAASSKNPSRRNSVSSVDWFPLLWPTLPASERRGT
jgi:hypothetical protein